MNTNNQNPTAARTLAGLLKVRGTLSQTQILSLLQPVIAALSQMHSQGLVHGHISPETIWLRDSSLLLFSSPLPDNYRKYLSQSLSCDEKERLGCTAFLGTPDASETSDDSFDAYRAPETYISSRFVSPAADVYSLCAVIYTAVTGCVRESVENILFNREAKPVCEVLASDIQDQYIYPQVSVKLMEILKTGMSLFPKDRFSDLLQLDVVLKASAVNPHSRPDTALGTAKLRPQLDNRFIDKLASEMKNSYPNFKKSAISSITFLDTIENMPAEHVVLSKDSHGKIFAWVKSKLFVSNKYDVFVAADGGISASYTMNFMFYNCTSLEAIYFGNFDTSNATGMQAMFAMCYNLTNIDLSNFDTSNVTNMHGMFTSCGSLTNIDLGSFNTSNVTTMESMFSFCGLTNIDLGSFNTSNVTNMEKMFMYCDSLTNINIGNFDTSNVSDMTDIFKGCHNLSPDIKKKIAGNTPN